MPTLRLDLIVKDAGTQVMKTFGATSQKELNAVSEGAKKMGIAFVAAATAAAAAATKLGLDSIKAASDLQETQSKFDVVFKGNEMAAESFAKTLVDSYLMSTNEAKAFMAQQQDLLVPMGMNSEAATVLSADIVKLAADMGSFNNLPTEEVLKSIRSALIGEFEPMRKFGTVLSVARIEQIAFNEGLIKTKADLTPLIKAQVAYGEILKTNAFAVGDIARTSDSYANLLKKLEARTTDLKAKIGDELLPIASDYLDILGKWVEKNDELIKQKVGEALKTTETALKGIVGIYKSLPPGVVGPAGAGIIVRIISGSTPLGTLVVTLGLLNSQLSLLGLGITQLPEKLTDYMTTFDDVVEATREGISVFELYARRTEEGYQMMSAHGAEAHNKLVRSSDSMTKAVVADAEEQKEAWRRTFSEVTRYFDGFSDEYMEMLGGMQDALKSSTKGQTETIKKETEVQAQQYNWFASTASSHLSTGLFNEIKGEAMALENMWADMLDSMLRALVDWAAQAAVQFALSSIFGTASAGVGGIFAGAGSAAAGTGLGGMLGFGGGAGAGFGVAGIPGAPAAAPVLGPAAPGIGLGAAAAAAAPIVLGGYLALKGYNRSSNNAGIASGQYRIDESLGGSFNLAGDLTGLENPDRYISQYFGTGRIDPWAAWGGSDAAGGLSTLIESAFMDVLSEAGGFASSLNLGSDFALNLRSPGSIDQPNEIAGLMELIREDIARQFSKESGQTVIVNGDVYGFDDFSEKVNAANENNGVYNVGAPNANVDLNAEGATA